MADIVLGFTLNNAGLYNQMDTQKQRQKFQ